MKLFLYQVAPWLLVATGIVALIFGIRNISLAAVSKSWPGVPGVVEESSVEINPPSPSGPRQAQDAKTTYGARIRYRFTVDGRNYQGDRIGLGDYSASYKGRVDEVVARYPKEGTVTVYYKPGNPAECLLEPGVQFQSWLLPVVGCVLLAAGSFWLRSKR